MNNKTKLHIEVLGKFLAIALLILVVTSCKTRQPLSQNGCLKVIPYYDIDGHRYKEKCITPLGEKNYYFTPSGEKWLISENCALKDSALYVQLHRELETRTQVPKGYCGRNALEISCVLEPDGRVTHPRVVKGFEQGSSEVILKNINFTLFSQKSEAGELPCEMVFKISLLTLCPEEKAKKQLHKNQQKE